MEILYLLLPAIFGVGIVTSHEDIKAGKIRNVWVAIGLLYSISVVSVLFVAAFWSGTLNYSYVFDFFANLLVVFFFSFIVWYIGLWSPGDAKIFIVYSAMIPLSIYKFGYIAFFPSSIILINTFVPLLLFYFFKIMQKTSFEEKVVSIKKSLNPKLILSFIFFALGFAWLNGLFSFIFGIRLDFFSGLFVLGIVYLLIEKLLPNRIFEIGTLLTIFRLIFDYGNLFTFDFLYSFISIFTLCFLVRFLVIDLSSKAFSSPINIEDLKSGMMPAEKIIKERGKYKKDHSVKTFFNLGKNRNFIHGHILSEGDVKMLRRLHSNGDIKEHTIRIHQTIPFAPFIFLGVLITIFSQGVFLNMFY